MSYIYKLINHQSPHTTGYYNNKFMAPRMTQKCQTLREKRDHRLQHRGIRLLEAYI